jgi:hypothetical protein
VAEELELQTNTELTRQIHALTTEMHRRMVGDEGLRYETHDGRALACHGDVGTDGAQPSPGSPRIRCRWIDGMLVEQVAVFAPGHRHYRRDCPIAALLHAGNWPDEW